MFCREWKGISLSEPKTILIAADTPIGYEELSRVLELAIEQSANGKGKERHAVDRPFTEQPIMLIQEMVGPGFALGQACKKIQESCRMDTESAKQELLGAIVYLAAAYLQREKDALP